MDITKQYIKKFMHEAQIQFEADNLLYAYYERYSWETSKTIKGLAKKAQKFGHDITTNDILVLRPNRNGTITMFTLDEILIFPSKAAAMKYATELDNEEYEERMQIDISDYTPDYFDYISGPMPNEDGTPGKVQVQTKINPEEANLLSRNPDIFAQKQATAQAAQDAIVDYFKQNYSNAGVIVQPGEYNGRKLVTVKIPSKIQNSSPYLIYRDKSLKSLRLSLGDGINITKDAIIVDYDQTIPFSSYNEMLKVAQDLNIDPIKLPTEAQYQILADKKLYSLYNKLYGI